MTERSATVPDGPFPVSNFQVSIGDEQVCCRSVSGIVVSAGGEKTSDGEGAAPSVTIRRAVSASKLLYDWASTAAAGGNDPRDVVIEQLGVDGEPTGIGWMLRAAEPVLWRGPELDALTSAVSEETIELRYAAVRRL